MLIAYLGGIRSGKSAMAQERVRVEADALALGTPVYLGTLLSSEEAHDAGLAKRLLEHRRSRPAAWPTVEVGRDLVAAGRHCLEGGHRAWLLDGLGAWGAHFLDNPTGALHDLNAFLDLARTLPLLVIVLDEVGLGGVPAHPAARVFADLNGALNQAVFSRVDEAIAAQAGLQLRLK